MTRSTPRHRTAPWFAAVFSALALALPAVPVHAQSQFEPVIRVNDKRISSYEIEQRILLLERLGAFGDLEEEARERLIDERLQVQAAEVLGLSLTAEEIEQGIEEFAGRSNTDSETFLAVLNSGGVATETFVDFVEAGLLWRGVIQQTIAPPIARAVRPPDVDRAIALAGQDGTVRVLLSEIILPARNPQELAQAEDVAARLAGINGFEAFSAAARQVSASQSRPRGGRIDWLPLGNLPPPVRAQLLTMQPGGITDPLRIPNAIAVFQLRALEELPPAEAEIAQVDYARFLVPGGPSEASRVAQRIDTCDDLYGEGRRLPEEYLARREVAPSQVPADIARELERLDPGEVSTRLTQGELGVLVMLCSRTTAQAAELDRNAVRNQLVNQRVTAAAEARLAELRAEAEIVFLE